MLLMRGQEPGGQKKIEPDAREVEMSFKNEGWK
jgi:hypothetical protein